MIDRGSGKEGMWKKGGSGTSGEKAGLSRQKRDGWQV